MPDQFQELLLGSLPRLRAYAILLTKDRTRADDLLQEAVLRALCAKHQFQPGTNFNAWIHRILHNQFISFLRQQRRPMTTLDDVSESCLSQPAAQEDKILTREVIQALSKLPEGQREALILISSSGMSYDEAASILGCSVGTVKSRVWRARRQMEKMIFDEDEREETTEAATSRPARRISNMLNAYY